MIPSYLKARLLEAIVSGDDLNFEVLVPNKLIPSLRADLQLGCKLPRDKQHRLILGHYMHMCTMRIVTARLRGVAALGLPLQEGEYLNNGHLEIHTQLSTGGK